MSEYGTTDEAAEPSAPALRRRSPLVRTVVVGLGIVAAIVAGAVAADRLPSQAEPAEPAPAEATQELEPVSRAEETPLPDWTLEGFGSGEPVDLTDYRGEPLLVNFWATWCAPCVVEMPEFEEVSRELSDEVVFLGVNSQDRAEAAEPFVEELGITYDLATDKPGDLFAEVNGFGWPTTLLVDADGIIRYRHTGPVDADELRDLLAEHLDVGR